MDLFSFVVFSFNTRYIMRWILAGVVLVVPFFSLGYLVRTSIPDRPRRRMFLDDERKLPCSGKRPDRLAARLRSNVEIAHLAITRQLLLYEL